MNGRMSRFSDNGVEVSNTALGKRSWPRGALILLEEEMVRFLFSPAGPSATVDLADDLKFLKALLPLDFYLWPLERV